MNSTADADCQRGWGSLPPLVVLLGATAVGKTELSLQLCERYGGEIVGADSRQVYRGMDIGSAKPTLAERARATHHLVDIREPDEVLTLAEFQRLAYQAIDDIHRRGKLPVLVGGTVLYLRAVVDGLRIPEVPPNPELREELEQLLAAKGREALFELLAGKDPQTAAVIDANNPRRLIRALEIVMTTGRSKVELEGSEPPPYAVLKIGLNRTREGLHARIDRRVERMVEQGLVDEVRTLMARGYSPSLPAMTSLGYREVAEYLQGDCTLPEAILRIQAETHRYLRHQCTWLRQTPCIHWVDMQQSGAANRVYELVDGFMSYWSE